jgi:hypothetical protein
MLQEVKIRTRDAEALKPILRLALEREIKLLGHSIQRTRERLTSFEKQFSMSTDEFLRRFTKDDLGETLDFIDWYGETKMLAQLEEQKRALEKAEIT